MKINGGWIALLVIIILITIAILGFVWWKFFYKKNEQNSGFLTRHRFKKTTHLLSMNNKYQNKNGIVLESGKLSLFKNIKLTQKLELKKWAARVSDQLSGIVIAAPGSGKTQSTLLPTIMFNAVAKDKPRMIVTDPKGECYKATHKFLEQQGIKTYVLNFNDSNSTKNLYTHCFNPLSKIIELHKKYCAAEDSIAKEIYLGKLTASINAFIDLFDAFSTAKQGDDFWYREGKTFTKFVLALMLFALENHENKPLEIYDYDQINLGNLYKNIGECDILLLAEYLSKITLTIKKPENWFTIFNNWTKARPENILSFQQQAGQLLEIFNNTENKYWTIKSDFDLHNFLKEQSVLFLVLPNSETKRKVANFFLEIFYDNLMEIVSNDYDDKLPFPCWFLIDEAGTMQHISWLGEVLNQGRGRNMHLLMVFQNTEQIDAKYKGQGLTKSSQYKILYSSQDLKYAEEIAKAIGYKQDAKNQQDLIIKPNQILKIEPEKSLFVSVKENKPYFTNNLAFWKVENIKTDSKIYSQPIFGLNKKYLQDFNFKKLLEKVLIQTGINLQTENQVKKQPCTKKELENKEISSIEQQGKETKKAMMLELNNFLNSNNFNDDIKENIQKPFLILIKNLTDFEKVFDKNQNQTIYQLIKNNIDEIWEQIDRNIEWAFLKNLQNQTREIYHQNKELYEIMENEKYEEFDFDLSDLQKQNKQETQTEQNINKNIEITNFERKPLGNNPLLRQAMMKFWRQKWGDKLTAEIFQDKKKKE